MRMDIHEAAIAEKEGSAHGRNEAVFATRVNCKNQHAVACQPTSLRVAFSRLTEHHEEDAHIIIKQIHDLTKKCRMSFFASHFALNRSVFLHNVKEHGDSGEPINFGAEGATAPETLRPMGPRPP